MSRRYASEALSGVDHAWWRMDQPTNRMVIHGLLHFPDAVDVERLRAKLARQLEPFARFRQRLKLGAGGARWEEDPSFTYEAHVVEHRIAAPGDKAALQDFVGGLMGNGLPEERPLWQIYVVNGLESGSAVVVQVHHAVADGFALVYLMLALADEGAKVELPIGEPPRLPGETGGSGGGAPGAWERTAAVARGGWRAMSDPGVIWRGLKLGGGVGKAAAGLLSMSREPETPLVGELTGRKVAAWSDGLALAALKEAARGVGGTLNDLLLAALAGAVRRYLVSLGVEVEGLELRAIVPVNLRPLHERTTALGNDFGLVFLDFPVGIEDARERTRELKRRMDKIKGSPEAFVTLATLRVVGRMPAAVQRAVLGLFRGKASFIITNMPGPVTKVPFTGQLIDDIMFWVPQSQGVGVGLSIFSYDGRVRIGVAADAGLVSEPGALVDAFHAELEEMVEA